MKLGKKLDPKDKSMLYSRPIPKKEFSGKTPNILIGSYGYPTVNVGALIDEAETTTLDNPKELALHNRDINNILQQRQSLINSQLKVKVKDINKKFTLQTQEIAKSKIAVDSEVELEKTLSNSMKFYEQAMPHGPSALLKKLQLTSNPSIPKAIERTTSDTDVKAQTAMYELQNKGFDEYYLTKLLSTGTLGKDRKIVPTKWSITAVDDALGNKLRLDIINNKEADVALYKGDYLGNYYLILIIPGEWSFELLEVVLPTSEYNDSNEIIIGKDYEFTQGRKNYATNTTGGYYASRLPILEQFKKTKRQGRVVVFRIITKEYTVPLGVWVVREGVRTTLLHRISEETVSQEEVIKRIKEELSLYQDIKEPSKVINTSTLLRVSQSSLKKWL